ncbi:hypothetical protein ABZP36_005301 [Zizania latifolia]
MPPQQRECCRHGPGPGWRGGEVPGGGAPFYVPLRKRLSVDGKAPAPRICIWECDGEAGDITCDIVAAPLRRSCSAKAMPLPPPPPHFRMMTPPPPRPQRGDGEESRRPGEAIRKGHRSYSLMLNLQLGIRQILMLSIAAILPSPSNTLFQCWFALRAGCRYSVGKSSALPFKKLAASDFDPREKIWTRFPPEGSKFTPPHHSVDFRWKDYCPAVFRCPIAAYLFDSERNLLSFWFQNDVIIAILLLSDARQLRKLFGVDPAEYMLAICGNDTLRELASPGKSGSCFFITQDDRFMIKTVKKSEVKVLIRMLRSYYERVRQYKSTLLTRFYGTHCIKQAGCPKVRFIIMGNFCRSEYKIHRRFDLKGSSHGRTIDKTEQKIDETTTLKDLDLQYAFLLQRFWYEELMNLMWIFLANVNCGNYFVLLPPPSDIRKPLIQLGINMPAQAEFSSKKIFNKFLLNERHLFITSPSGGSCDVYLFFGIIDILQDYDITKKLEHAYKSFQVNPGCISAVDPKLYSRRFQDFIRRFSELLASTSSADKHANIRWMGAKIIELRLLEDLQTMTNSFAELYGWIFK